MTQYTEGQLYNREGEPVELTDIQRVNLICFKCTQYIEDNYATLISHAEKRSSDNVSTRTTIELCEKCYHEIMRFCGSVED